MSVIDKILNIVRNTACFGEQLPHGAVRFLKTRIQNRVRSLCCRSAGCFDRIQKKRKTRESVFRFLSSGFRKGILPDLPGNQKVISLFLDTRMKISMEVMVSTFRIVASAAAGPSEPRVTWA